MISTIFGKLLGLIYNFVHNYGLSIIIFTVFVKVLLMPLSVMQINSTKRMQEIQPKIKEIQNKYKNDKETLNIKTMELYKENKINPLAGCLPLLIQFPIIIGLFNTLRNPLQYVFSGSTELATEALNKGFLWISDLGAPDFLGSLFGATDGVMAVIPGILPILAAITTYLQMHMTGSGTESNSQMKTMTYMMPFMILFMGRTLASGLMLYWLIGNIFQIVQQYAMTHYGIKGEIK